MLICFLFMSKIKTQEPYIDSSCFTGTWNLDVFSMLFSLYCHCSPVFIILWHIQQMVVSSGQWGESNNVWRQVAQKLWLPLGWKGYYLGIPRNHLGHTSVPLSTGWETASIHKNAMNHFRHNSKHLSEEEKLFHICLLQDKFILLMPRGFDIDVYLW